ncbi:hypothetical protein AB0E69_07955 [Kribbella sp. NPDC026611]|uniref:hypothetical protein n=1 Tax=Kribbella sp. NPDC026611 TaxID=3154911 RepID=UPI0033FD1C73
MISVGKLLVGLYPQPFRERWGHELVAEVDRSGWRGAPRLVWAIAGMWLHPAIWPTDSILERRRRVAALAVVVTAMGWLTAHAVLELTGAVPRALAHSWILNACDGTTFAGFLLAVPVPRPRRRQFVDLVAVASRRIAIPVLLAVGVVLAVNRFVAPATELRSVVAGGWWLALMLIAAQAVRTVADVNLSAVWVPGPRRLALGLWMVAAGLGGTGLTILMPTIVGNGDRVAGAVGGLALLALAAAVNGTVRDLGEVRTT